MDQIIEKRNLTVGKSEEEINKLLGPEGQNFIERAIYIFQNGQQFQKLFICSNIKLAVGMDFYVSELIQVFITKLQCEEEIVSREMIKALCELIPLIKIKEEHCIQLADICLTIFTSFPTNLVVLDNIAELLKLLIKKIKIDTQPYFEALFLETDNQMYEILKIIEIFYSLFNTELKRQAINQIKSSVKHKDERIRKQISILLLNADPNILSDVIKEFDWIDKLTNLIYDQSKEVRRHSAQLFLKIYPIVSLDIQSQRFQMLLENIIENIDQQQFSDCDKITLYIQNNEILQTTLIGKLKQLTNSTEYQLNYLNYLQSFYDNIQQFNCKSEFDQHLISIVDSLSEDQRSFAFLAQLIPLLPLLDQDTHFNILNVLFANFELNQLAFIPFLNDILIKSTRLNKNKQWINQLQKIYDLFKRSIFIYETKGLWYEIEFLVPLLSTLSKILLLQRDYQSLSQKMILMGSSNIRQKVTIHLVESIPEMDSIDQREQVVQQFFQFLNNQNYQYRLLLLEFCIQVCKKRSRKFFISHNIINAITLQFDQVPSVRIKLAKLIYEIKLLLWNEEKEILIRVNQIMQMLIQDKKPIVQQISKDYWSKLQAMHFHHPESILQQAQINQVKENLEGVNIKQMQPQSSTKIISQKHIKTENCKARNQTPTAKPPLQQKGNRTNNFLLPPIKATNKKSVGRPFSKSPVQFK